MARVVEKVKENKVENNNQEKGKTILIILLSIVSVAILALIVTVIVLQVTKKDEETDETTTYEPTYTKDNTEGLKEITWEEFDALIDVNTPSDLVKSTVYVYVYSPNYDYYNNDGKDTYGADEELISLIKEASKAYQNDENIGFYVLNVLSSDNKSTTARNDAFDSTRGFALCEIKNDEITETYKKLVEIKNTLKDMLGK